MKRIPLFMIALVASSALAETDYISKKMWDSVRYGYPNDYQIQTLRVKGVGTSYVGGDLTVSGTLRSGSMTADYLQLLAATPLTVTNNQTVALVAGKVNVLVSTGKADGLTNTILFANFSAGSLNMPTYVVNSSTSTNAITVAKTGNFKSPTVAMATNDVMYVIAVATNVLVGK